MERGILGIVLFDGSHADTVITRLREPEALYELRHQALLESFIALHRSKIPIDTISVIGHLKETNRLSDVGGLKYIQDLANDAPSPVNLPYYLDVVLEKYSLRRIVHTCTDVASRVYEHDGGPIDDLMFSVRSDLGLIVRENVREQCERFTTDDLEKFNLDSDENNLIGNRYLTRGSSLVINGASGRGKSSLLMLRLMLWAMGQPFFGLKPVSPLTSVVFQTENNCGDLAKAYQGARNFLSLNPIEHADQIDLLKSNIQFVRPRGLVGEQFLDFARSELSKSPRDLAVLDPLSAFPDEDINTQHGAATFLRRGLDGISFETGATWVINHHTPKPPRDPKHSGRRRLSDYQYSGAGSFDIPGWARAVETLDEAQDGVFRLVFAKRGNEFPATHPDGTPTQVVWLRHATTGGIHWEQIDPPVEQEPQKSANTGGKPNQKAEVATMNLYEFCSNCTQLGESQNAIAKRLEQWLAKQGKDVSFRTCVRIIPMLVENGKLTKTSDSSYIKGPNA